MIRSLRRTILVSLARCLPSFRCTRLRVRMIRAAGYHEVSQNATLADAPTIIGPAAAAGGLRIGARAFLNVQCLIECHAEVSIGEAVAIGQRVAVLTETHEISEAYSRAGERRTARVDIGDGCWIGAGVTILPGVTIGGGTVVGAGSVVVHDLPANVVAAGCPATVRRELPTQS